MPIYSDTSIEGQSLSKNIIVVKITNNHETKEQNLSIDH